ncbi:hypothetical protein EUZ85_19245 [Hahella sp. KA22]|uniref:hypothetical protein n=1 Tax=Hahella sp. KA22 TaxID=1628392 RepID=UPI000FDF51DF|nr:hypothetical protein [Hahella sp. KA22]AZZ92741.1 hypothetical protein ENC22_16665 [Hahella sp. KA22]QAY56115.1 hypothetical protein EUZ85_19245 [Hahella sp. KA22]
MSVTLKAYADAALTTELSQLSVNQKADGSTGPVDVVFYLGSVASNSIFEATSDPGVDDIVLSIADANPGLGHEASEVKLALSSAGLDTAVAGAPLSIGSSVSSGVPNAIPVHCRIEDTTGTVGLSTELSLQTNELQETAL